MKKFVLTTKNESSDYYVYFIEHKNKPTNEELDIFLAKNANEIEDEFVYEYIQDIVEIKKCLPIPKK